MPAGPKRRGARFVALALFLAPAVASAQTTAAQTSGALDRFDPSPAGDTFFSFPSADVAGRLRFSASATFSYAHDPLVLHSTAGGSFLPWVSSQGVLHAQVSAEVLRRVKLDVDLPAVLLEGGTSGTLGPYVVTAPHGAHVGDV